MKWVIELAISHMSDAEVCSFLLSLSAPFLTLATTAGNQNYKLCGYNVDLRMPFAD